MEPIFVDEAAGSRTSHERAGHQAKGGSGNGDHASADCAGGLQFRSVGCCRAGAAHQGDRAAADAQKWILAEQGHDAAPQEVLNRNHGNSYQQTEDYRLSALQQGRNTDGEANSSEEHNHKDTL